MVNVRTDPYDIYIGRNYGKFKNVGWGNPFNTEDRQTNIAKYRAWILQQPHLMARLHELKGKRLGCWCKPESCHGDVLAELAESCHSHPTKAPTRQTGPSACPRRLAERR